MHFYTVVLVQKMLNQWTEPQHIFPKAEKLVFSLKPPRIQKDPRWYLWAYLKSTWGLKHDKHEANFKREFQRDQETKGSQIASAHEQLIARLATDRNSKHMGVIFWILTKLTSIHSFFFSFEELGKSHHIFCIRKLSEVFKFLDGNKWRQST